MTVGALPPSIRPPTTGLVGSEGLQYGARFKPGSGPVVREVQAFVGGFLLVEFSEGLSVNGGTLAAYLGVKNPDLSSCAYLPPGGNVVPPTQSGVTFQCSPSAAAQKKVSVTLAAGLLAPSNKSLEWLDGSASSGANLTKPAGTFAIDLARSCGKDCVSWRP